MRDRLEIVSAERIRDELDKLMIVEPSMRPENHCTAQVSDQV